MRKVRSRPHLNALLAKLQAAPICLHDACLCTLADLDLQARMARRRPSAPWAMTTSRAESSRTCGATRVASLVREGGVQGNEGRAFRRHRCFPLHEGYAIGQLRHVAQASVDDEQANGIFADRWHVGRSGLAIGRVEAPLRAAHRPGVLPCLHAAIGQHETSERVTAPCTRLREPSSGARRAIRPRLQRSRSSQP